MNLQTKLKSLELIISENLGNELSMLFGNMQEMFTLDDNTLNKIQLVKVESNSVFKCSNMLFDNSSTENQYKLILTAFFSLLNGHFNTSIFNRYTEITKDDECVSGTTDLFLALDLIIYSQIRLFDRIISSKDSRAKIVEFTNQQNEVINAYMLSFDSPNADIISYTIDYLSRFNKEEKTHIYDVLNTKLFRGTRFSKHSEIFTEYSDYIADHISVEGRSTNSVSKSGISGEFSLFSPFTALLFSQILVKLIAKYSSLLSSEYANFGKSVTFTISRSFVSYEERLLDAFSGMVKNDYSMSRPNRNYLYTGLIFPSMIANEVKLLFAVDYSGSVGDLDLAHQLGAIQEIIDQYPNYTAEVITFSTYIHTKVPIANGENLVDAIGRLGDGIGEKGGTNFSCVYDYAFSEEFYSDDLAMICIISADGDGGTVEISEENKERYKGRHLILVSDNYKGRSNLTALTKGNVYTDSNIVFFKPLS